MAEPLSVAASVAGVVSATAQVLEAGKRIVRRGTNPGTAAESSSAAEEFRIWARINAVYECRDADEKLHRDFVPSPLVRRYLRDSDYALARQILGEFHTDVSKITQKPRATFDLKLLVDEFTQVLSILVETGGGDSIEWFMTNGISDRQLPIDLDHLPVQSTSKLDIWKSFCEHQWRYCVPEFNVRLENTVFHHNRILPIINKEKIGQGATATTYKIKIHPLYDGFERNSSFQSRHTVNTYALKSFVRRDSKYYLSEIDACEKLSQCGDASLVHYYGSYRQDDTYNIVLELADRGSLEQYLSYCQPPTTRAEILQFWGSLFKIIRGLVCIHEAGGASHLYGVHQNIKPATILIRDNSLGSQYGWEFKLGGLGSCQFSRSGNFPIQSAFGTRTYGSPECYLKRQGPSVNFNQNFDIWSLGCIFSEVAVWIASGYHGVQNYRILRTTEADHELGDCFHNGKSVLGAVGTTHLHLLSNLRQSDAITAVVVRLVEGQMMVPSERRMTAKELWQECQGILSQAEAVLERRKDKAPQLTAPSNPDGHHQFVLDRQQSSIDIVPDTLFTKQDQGTTKGFQSSLRRFQSNEDVGKVYLPLPQSPQLSAILPKTMRFPSTPAFGPGQARAGEHPIRQPRGPPSLDELIAKPTTKFEGSKNFTTRTRRSAVHNVRRGLASIPMPESTISKEHKSKIPYLSVEQALEWKEHAQSQGRIGLGSRVRIRYGSSSEELPHGYLRERLRGRKHILLIDTAKRMKPYWQELTTLVGLLAYIAKSDDDIEMFSNNGQRPLKSKKSTTLVTSLEKTQLVATWAIDTMLGKVLDGYVAELRRNPSVKPMNLYVFTDGIWESRHGVKLPIRNIRQHLRNHSMPASQVAIQFIRFGYSLSQLDVIKDWDHLSRDLRFVDKEYSSGNVWKMLLGALDVTFHVNETEEAEVQKPPNSLTPDHIQFSAPTPALRAPPPSPAGGIFIEILQDVPDPLILHGTNRPSSILDRTSEQLPLPIDTHVESVPFHDSGYEGSTERQQSLVAKSVPEISFEAGHSSPDTQDETKQVLSAEPSEQDENFAKTAVTRDQDYDIRSILSEDLDIQSKRSSKVTYQERLAEENLGYLLAQNPQLRPLSEEALRRVGKIRFVDNLRRLLKRYYIDLRPIATTKLEIATVNLLRSRYSRARLSQQISDILAPENDETDEQLVHHAEITRQELENWIVRHPEFVSPQEEFDDLDLEIDDSSSDDEEVVQEAKIAVGEVHEEVEEPNLPNITQMESFLLNCGDGTPFQRLSTHLRIFLLPPTLGPLVRILMSLPADHVWLDDQEDTSFSNKFKSFVEDMTEENWNWWPLRPRMRFLGKDQTRLNWSCHCDAHLWTELPRFTAEKLQALVRGKPPSTQSPHLCAKRSRNTPTVYARIIQAAGLAQSSTGTSSSAPSSNAATTTTGIQVNQLGPTGPRRPAASPLATGPSVSGGQGIQVNINTGTVSELFVLFGVKGSRRTLELAQIDVSKHKEDSIFFQDLRREYRHQRGFWRYWLSVWKLRHCDFVKFEKIRANRVISNEKHDLPVDKLYEYKPKPPDADIPPIDPHEFELSLSPCNSFCIFKLFHDCIEPPDGSLALERIPKRKEALELKVGTREQAWGLLTQYSISALLLLVYLIICFVPFVGFWVCWQIKHPDDLQNASTPLMVFATLLCVWFASLVYLKGQ